MATLLPTRRLNNADLPTFGRPTLVTLGSTWSLFMGTPLASERFGVGVSLILELPDAGRHVNAAGDRGEKGGRQNDVNQWQKSQLEHDPGNGRHLQNGRHFSRPTWPNLHFAVE